MNLAELNWTVKEDLWFDHAHIGQRGEIHVYRIKADVGGVIGMKGQYAVMAGEGKGKEPAHKHFALDPLQAQCLIYHYIETLKVTP